MRHLFGFKGGKTETLYWSPITTNTNVSIEGPINRLSHRLPIFINEKSEIYNLILVIVNCLIKIVYNKPVKVSIDLLGLVKVIIDIVIRHHGLPNSIVSNWGPIFTFKFWSSFYYILGIKQRLSTVFYPQIDGQSERQNSTIEVYFREYVNYKQDN